jgi:competence protein ComEC
MFVALSLILIILCWFQYGILISCVITALVAIGFAIQQVKVAGVFFLLALICIATLQSEYQFKLPSELQHQEFFLSTCFLQVPKQFNDDYRSVVGEVIEQPLPLKLRKIKLSSYSLENAIPIGKADVCIRGIFRLKQPFGKLIPGSFNSDAYFFSNQIDAQAILVSLEEVWVKPTFVGRKYNQVSSLLESPETLGVWTALTLGWSAAMPSEVKDLLAANQLMHLFVISGMHFGFIAVVCVFLIKSVGRLFVKFWVVTISEQLLVLLIVLTTYLLAIDSPLPALRAYIMLMVPSVFFLLGYKVGYLNSLSISAILICIFQPESWLSVSPWLSFVSVGVLLLIVRWRLFIYKHWLIAAIGIQLIMSLLSVFWAIIFGFKFNVFAVFIALIATPIVLFVMLPISFILFLIPNEQLIDLYSKSVLFAIKFLTYFESYAFEMSWIPVSIGAALMVLVGFVIWHRNSWATSLTSLILLVSFVFITEFIPFQQPSRITLDFLDVGHGQAILISTPEGRYLLDTGGEFNDGVSLFEATLERVIPKIDGLIISHADQDHSAGADYIKEMHPELPTWSGNKNAFQNPGAYRDCHQHTKINDFLAFIPIPNELQNSSNNQSCVLKLMFKEQRVVFTSDADKFIEYYLIQEYSELLPADLVVLGHHGSDSSSVTDWLDLHKGSFFVVGSADRAAPKWPSRRIEQWFDENNAYLYRTSRLGSIRISMDGRIFKVKTWDSAYRKELIN